MAEALRLNVAAYQAPQSLEEKIYDGFPSWDDKRRMEAWHRKATWEARLDAMREIEKPELRQLALRTIFVNAPEALAPNLRELCATAIAPERYTLQLDRKWNTVGKLMAEVDAMLAEDPEDAEALNIRAWALATYSRPRTGPECPNRLKPKKANQKHPRPP